MQENTITPLPDPSGFSPDPLTDVIREGARKLIEQAIEAELAALMASFAVDKLEDGRARLVRHGHLPEREVMTGIGPVPVKVPRVRDRGAGEDKITFTPSILPRYLRKAKSVEELLPWLYLKGVSTGDFTEALEALLVTLAVTVDLRQRFGLQHSKPKTEMTMTDERMALIELVEQQADGDLVREMLAFAAERIMEAEAMGARACRV